MPRSRSACKANSKQPHEATLSLRESEVKPEPRLETKQANGYWTDDGRWQPPYTLCRFVDDVHNPGCWYSTLSRAVRSYERIAGIEVVS